MINRGYKYKCHWGKSINIGQFTASSNCIKILLLFTISESLGYDYGEQENFPDHGLGEDYDLLMDDNGAVDGDILEEEHGEIEGDYEYNNALHEVLIIWS